MRLILRRRLMGLSQTKLAELSGLCRATIVQTERGTSSPSLHTLDAYARVVGMRPHLALLSEDDHPRGYCLIEDEPD